MPGMRLITPKIDAALDELDAVVVGRNFSNGEQVMLHVICLGHLLEESGDPELIASAMRFMLKYSAEPTHPETRAELKKLAGLCSIDWQPCL